MMSEHIKILLIGILGLVISVPIWYTIIGTEQFSLSVFLNPSLIFWLLFGLLAFLFGYYSTDEE